MGSSIDRERQEQEARRLGRARWPIRQFRLGEEPSDDLSETTTPEERIAMVWALTIDSYAQGKGLPEATPRSTWPVRLRSLGAAEVD